MSWKNKIISMARIATGAMPDFANLSFFNLPIAGVAVNERTAMNYSAVFRCVKAITDPMLLMPFRVLKVVDGKREIQSSHPVDWILHRQANPEMSASTFREVLTAHAVTWGNGYAEIEFNRMDEVIAMWPITPDRVTPKRNDNGRLYYQVRQENGGTVDIQADHMFHLKGLGFDGVTGYSVIGLGKEAISMGLATEQFGGAFFGNGAILGTVISVPAGVTVGENGIKNLQKTFDKKHKGASQSHRTEVLDQGMTATTLGVPPEQAQFLETRKFQLAEVARWFGVPLHKLMSDAGQTFKNVEQLDIVFVSDTLMPWNKRWEEEVDIKLIGRDHSDLHAKMNTKGLLRGDIQTRKEWYKAMFAIGVYSVNEIRAYEDEDSIGTDGDLRMVPLNMVSLSEAYKNGGTSKDKNNNQTSRSKMLAAGAPVYIESCKRLARKESKFISRLAGNAKDSKTFSEKLTAFYLQHNVQLFEAIEPSIKVIATLSNKSAESFTSPMREEVGNYCEDSYNRATSAYADDSVERFTSNLEFEAHDRAIVFLEKQLTSMRQAA